jgi:Putative phage tail protein
MATLVFGTLGATLGGPMGGALGMLVGRQANAALFGSPGRQGPRLRELDVTLSSYGQTIPRIYGRMRTAGAVIWATELEEHAEALGAGKGQPALTRYSYTANLAVALSSRRIERVGRIWADGKLLRGAAGDLKVGGTLRVYRGLEDQPVDPLIAAAEGETRCPAFRGQAYVVFEGLELATFGNRLPALTFEVIAEETADLGAVLAESVPDCTVRGEAGALGGLAVEDSLQATIAQFQTLLPIAIDAAGAEIMVSINPQGDALPLEEAAASVADDAFAGTAGIARHRAPRLAQPPPMLRYFDIDRDYLPGAQHAAGQAGLGMADTIELPAAMEAGQARTLVESFQRRRDRVRDQLAWRTCALDGRVAPGTLVRLPQHPGTWRVESWEWRDTGVELELARVDASPIVAPSAPGTGAFLAPPDRLAAQTRLVAFELPWDGADGKTDRPRTVAAVGANGPEWSGAALFVDRGDGQLWTLGQAPRARALVGSTSDALAPASPLLLDRTSTVTVTLASPDQALTDTSLATLVQGTNLALVGDELIQFAKAEPLGGGVWRLSQFLRGCGGTEAAITGHRTGEPFALIDTQLTPLDPATLGPYETARVLALGRGDAEPVAVPLLLPGLGNRPLAPVHGRAEFLPNGSLRLSWTRRARGGWRWTDGVDMPLAEEAERYVVTFADASAPGGPMRGWTVDTAALELPASDVASLASQSPDGAFHVRQQGTRALSLPLFLARLN